MGLLLGAFVFFVSLNTWAYSRVCSLVFEETPQAERVHDITLPGSSRFNQVRGIPEDAPAKKLGLLLEVITAEILFQHGFDVVMNPKESTNPQIQLAFQYARDVDRLSKTRNPDFLVEGRVFDVYSPKNNGPVKVTKALNKKANNRQARRLVVNLMRNKAFLDGWWKIEELPYTLNRIAERKVDEVIAIYGDFDDPKVATVYPVFQHHPKVRD